MKGLHTASPITGTPEGYCLRLENWICRTDGLHVRDGHTVVSNIGAPVTSLHAHGSKIIATTAAQIFQDGVVLPGLNMSGGEWHSALLPNPGGLFLIMANGGDGLRVFDGATWQTVPISGINTADIVSLIVHHHRVWFVLRNSLTLYYLDQDAFTNLDTGKDAFPVPLGPLVRNGGSIAAIASLTQDGGRNDNDQLVAVTTEGEMVVFSGSDPATSQTWKQAGVYTVAKPIGRRCFIAHGGSLAYLSTKGLFPVLGCLVKPDAEKPLSAFSEPVWPTFCASIASGAWNMIESLDHEITIVSSPSLQWVLSSTNGWSTFTGLNATCWLSTPAGLFFGTSDGKVCKYGGGEDQSQPVSSYIVDRFDRLKSMGIKTAQQVRPLYTARHPYRPRVQMLANYRTPPDTFTARFTDGINYQWEDITWSMQPALWERQQSSRQGLWRSVSAEGTELALLMGMKTRTPVIYTGYDLQYEAGGSL